ncbi:MAG: hypothetical protein AUK47_08875 [Deltaproteobacteria bacterium CG2_30_63_29]|nr:MAG: hypothetical protein AUK47_08875 [Deltaproteobacteria bacterium CG2_30_63_29]
MHARTWLLLALLLLTGCRQSAPAAQEEVSLDTTVTTKDTSAMEDVPDVPDDGAELPILPRRCIENWPVDPKAMPSPSLPVDNAGQVLWTKEVPGGSFKGSLAKAGDRMAYLSGNTLVILDTEGNPINTFQDPTALTGNGPPVADADGNFYFGAANVISVTSEGEPLWRFELGPDIAGTETTYTSQLTLSPDGVLYFSATDGYLYAVKADDGTQVWRQEVGLSKYGRYPYGAYVGIGDALIAERGYHDPQTGTVSQHPVIDGEPMSVNRASYSHLFGYKVINADSQQFGVPVMDMCGELQWSLPGKTAFAVLVGFANSIVAIDDGEPVIYSSDGEPQAGPIPLDWNYLPKAIGADGTIYYTYCTDFSNMDGSVMSVQAYSPTLQRLWSVELGKPCLDEPPVLADDGVLYVLRSKNEQQPPHLELTAIQTGSPGLANTAYPTLRVNNRRTGWVGSSL